MENKTSFFFIQIFRHNGPNSPCAEKFSLSSVDPIFSTVVQTPTVLHNSHFQQLSKKIPARTLSFAICTLFEIHAYKQR